MPKNCVRQSFYLIRKKSHKETSLVWRKQQNQVYLLCSLMVIENAKSLPPAAGTPGESDRVWPGGQDGANKRDHRPNPAKADTGSG